ncbi:alcohol dehydrogenase [Amycolatopsis sp. GM8]|uniref:alcohol dehydrogenase n=1 Tax=Amycolatopsis sp. GM8 TaxID=2896530 RepID=UPI001F42B46D|nr:alcohol dehydrogenase [Amycolatopsis sp. GM8]
MKAFAVVTADDPTITEIELPDVAPEAGEVVLRVLHSGVCHTDVHLRLGYYDLGSAGRMRLVERGFSYPLVPGHEIVGEVVAAGPDARGVAIGDVRLVYPWIGCGACHRCAAGDDNLCLRGRVLGVNKHGGYAETVRVPDAKYLVELGGLDPASAAPLACSGLTAMAAANKVLPLPPDTPVVVIGAGGVGLNVVAVLAARGHAAICAADVNPDNLALAKELGATSTVLLGGDDDIAAVTGATGGPVEAVIDLVNSSSTAQLGIGLLTKAGLLVQVGLFGGEFTVPTPLMPLRALRLEGAFTGTLAELRDVVELAADGRLRAAPVLPGVLDRDGVSDSLDRLANGGVPGRIVLSASQPESL